MQVRHHLRNFSYLNLTFRAISEPVVKNMLTNLSSASVNDFSVIDVNSYQQTNQVEVLGTALLKKKTGVHGDNQFTIKAEREISGIKPLVLPVESGNKYASLQYVNGTWGTDNKAPYKDANNNIPQRTLPYDGSTYPYLTISDFLEDTIVKVPHQLNRKYYFDGNVGSIDNGTTFLIPIKPLYFKYFSIETLTTNMPDGRPAFEMEPVAGGSVHVTIRIPIVGSPNTKYIEYKRMYYSKRQSDISLTSNSGGMAEFDFTGFVMPSMKFQNDKEAFYTVSCISTFSNQFKFDFYENGEILHDIPMDCRNKEKGQFDYKAETYTICKRNFDFVKVTNGSGVSNLLIPIFLTHQNLEEFEFSIDLGTSNTHIEYKKENAASSESLTYKGNEAICSTFFVTSYREIQGTLVPMDLIRENDLMAADFIPSNVGEDSDFLFPTRTVLSYAKSTDWTERLRTFGLVNFNLTYNKRVSLPYNAKPMVNIKWSNKTNAQTAMQAYINNLMLLIRNKVVANNGRIAKTKITWFYPNSMSPRRLSQLREAWNSAYANMFDANGTTRNISESVAPIQYYFRRYATATNLINVDIGGGTTDIAFSSNGKVNYITSFKFAANSVFEDSLSDINPNNGIVDWFKGDIMALLQAQSLNDLIHIYNSNLGQPSNMASFLFSLKDNSATKSIGQNNIDFNKILRNDSKFKIVFILFYVAIIYHIAQIVKVKGLRVPRHIAFSGNGSKIISIISGDTKILSKFTKVIFEEVLGSKYEGDLDILGLEHHSNPKESTCKGGLITSEDNDEEIEQIVLKDSAGDMVSTSDIYRSIDTAQKKMIISSINEFFHLALTILPSRINLDDNFGVENNAIRIAQKECQKDLETYLDRGIELSIAESGSVDNKIEEALSFYPIKGVLQALSEKLNEYYSQNVN